MVLLKGFVARLEIQHQEHSAYRPNAVQPKQAKGSNVAGLIGTRLLVKSSFLVVVWSHEFSQCQMHTHPSLSVLCCLTVPSGMRYYNREKTLAPAKPLWYIKSKGFVMEAKRAYQIC